MELEPGTVVDRYTVQNVLGEGGMAVVYRVRHNQLGTHYALKVLSINSRAIRDRLLQEGRVQASLGHPNIVAVSDVIDVQGQPGLVMEYVRGPALDTLLREQRLTLEQASALASDIISAVAFAHSKELVHRDLKPANILLAITDTGLVPKITDFGLAKVVTEGGKSGRTRTGATMGTPHYMAPGQIRDAKNVGPEADVFSLGAILYELVTGRRAFDGDDLYEIFKAINEERYVPPREYVPDLPVRMEQAIVGALKANKAERIPDCHQLLAVWRGEVAVGEASPNSPVTRPDGPWSGDILARVSSLSSGDSSVDVPSNPSKPSQQTFALDGALVEAALDGESAGVVEASAGPELQALEGSLATSSERETANSSPSMAPTSQSSETSGGTLGKVGIAAGLMAAGGGLTLVAGALVVVGLLVVGAYLATLGLTPPPDTTPDKAVQIVTVPVVEEEPPPPSGALKNGTGPVKPPPPSPPSTTDAAPPAPSRPSEPVPSPHSEPPDQPTARDATPPSQPDEPAVDPEPTEPVGPTRIGASTPDDSPDEPPKSGALPPFRAPPPPLPTTGSLPRDLDPTVSPDPEVRAAAIDAREGTPGDTQLLWLVALNDPNAEIAEKAARALRSRLRTGVGDRAQHEAILQYLSFKGPREARGAVVIGLGNHGNDLDAVTVHLGNPSRDMRLDAVKACGLYGRSHPEQVGAVDRALGKAAQTESDKRVLRAIALARQLL